MTHTAIASFVESFNAKAAFNLCDLFIVDHYNGLFEVVHNGKTVIKTHSLFKACAKVHVILANA